MSALSAAGTVHSPVNGLPPIDPALEPADIRNGNQAAKNAYATGLGFEDILVNELTQQLTATMSGSGGSSDGLGGTSSDSGSDSTGADPAGGAYSQMLPGALTSSIISSGGTGIAAQIASALDPALAGR
jgi:hypothetical protein